MTTASRPTQPRTQILFFLRERDIFKHIHRRPSDNIAFAITPRHGCVLSISLSQTSQSILGHVSTPKPSTFLFAYSVRKWLLQPPLIPIDCHGLLTIQGQSEKVPFHNAADTACSTHATAFSVARIRAILLLTTRTAQQTQVQCH